jgi:hypothetical protein
MSKQLSGQRQPVKQTQRRERREEMRRQQQERLATKRKRKVIIKLAIACIVIIGAAIGFIALIPVLFPSTNTNSTNQLAPPVGNIQCDAAEQLAFHNHAHLSIYIDGKNVSLPAQVGITNNCFYWLHTHDTTGVIHMEAPKPVKLTLGTFLQLWRDQFSRLQYQDQLSSTTGWTVYIDGKPYNGDFNKIELKSHELITLAYNSPNVKPDTVYSWNGL